MIIRDIIEKNNDDLIIALSYLMDKPKSYFYFHADNLLEEDLANRILEIEQELQQGIPLQYAIGEWEFYGMLLKVDKRALIPRFETEIIVDYIIKADINKDAILDIGVGSGAISLSLGKNIPDAEVLGVDISDRALELALYNRNKIGLTNVRLAQSDLFEDIEETFDIIISNPPYISEDDYKKLDKKLYHEPKNALVGGIDGLYFYRRIIDEATSYLNKEGHLIFEIGYDQKDEINKLLVKSDFKNIVNLKDYNGYDRFILAQKG